LGLDRRSAVRFSFLLAIPVILGASVFKVIDLAGSPQPMSWYVFGLRHFVISLTVYLRRLLEPVKQERGQQQSI